MKPKISVIVPVYNVEEYLPKCLDSIINETFKDIEIIVINDGSKDNSEKIIDQYKKKDKRIVALSKENGGQGSARNMGLKKARGEYIVFVDSDDWIEKGMLEHLYNEAINNDSDIVVCDFFKVNGSVKERQSSFEVHGDSLIQDYILNISGPCWQLIKKSLIIDNELFFPQNIIYEDYAIVPIYALFAKKISYVKKAYYNYLIRSNSTMTQKFNNKFYNIIDASYYLLDKLKTYNYPYRDEYEYLIVNNLLRQTYFRLKDIKEAKKLLNDAALFIKDSYPNFMNNKYVKSQGLKYRIITYLIYKKKYKLLKLIHSVGK